jgi:hypothetical protein
MSGSSSDNTEARKNASACGLSGHQPAITASSRARIKSAEAAAATKLASSIIDFLRPRRFGPNRPLDSKPLIPFFEEYATTVFEAEAKEEIDADKSSASTEPEQAIEMLKALARRIEKSIVARPRPIWPRVVAESCEYLGMSTAQDGDWVKDVADPHSIDSETGGTDCEASYYVSYTVSVLMRPCTKQIRMALRRCVENWKGRVENLASANESALPIISTTNAAREEFLKDVKIRLKTAAKKHGIIQDFAREVLGIDPSVFHGLYKGRLKCSLEKLTDVAKKLNYIPSDLYRPEFDPSRGRRR